MKEYESTIKETSKSDENIDFIESEVKVYDFDAYTEDVCKEYRSKKSLSSVDAFALSDDGDFWFIEFKNARKSQLPKKSLPPKAYDSMYTAYFFLNQKYSIDELKSKAILFVVYNDDAISGEKKENPSKGFSKFKTKIGELAKIDTETRILFGLEKFKGFLYREIHTIGKQEFLEKYEKKCRLIGD